MAKRKRSELTEEDVGARIWPYDHEAIIYEREEDDDGGGGEELERRRRSERFPTEVERPPGERPRREGEADRGSQNP